MSSFLNKTAEAMTVPGNQSLPATLFLAGASVRAAAFSALRAGIRPVCADLFGDEDLRAVADVTVIKDYPTDLTSLAAAITRMPWIYTGALENHSKLVAEISSSRFLLGNGSEALQQVRRPHRLAELLRDADLPFLQIRESANAPPQDGAWLLKPCKSGGGHGIQIWDANCVQHHRKGGYYFQRRATGVPHSALFLAVGNQALLIGVTRQLIGTSESGAAPFAYCGSIGPVKLPPVTNAVLQKIGDSIVAAAGLRGLFGCDFILDGSNPWLVEVNPRYTASVEVFERAWEGVALLEWHCLACVEQRATASQLARLQRKVEALHQANVHFEGKSILFATVPSILPSLLTIFAEYPDPLQPPIADVPASGTTIAAGHPICTVFAQGETEADCSRNLQERIRCVKAAINTTNS